MIAFPFECLLIISMVSPIEIPLSFVGASSSFITASSSILYFSLNSLCQESCDFLLINGIKAVNASLTSAKTATVVLTFLSISAESISKWMTLACLA